MSKGTKYVTSKENIAALITEVQQTNAILADAQSKDEFRNYALEMINNNIGNNFPKVQLLCFLNHREM